MSDGHRILVLGGSRSGKSRFAESLLAGGGAVEYVATAAERPADTEWAERIRAHRSRRDPAWRTIETGDVAGVLRAGGSSELLVDSVTTWLARAMDECGCWADPPDATADRELARRVDQVCTGWARTPRRAVLVSDEVGSGVVPATAAGRRFRDALGLLNQRLAADADAVYLVIAGISHQLK